MTNTFLSLKVGSFVIAWNTFTQLSFLNKKKISCHIVTLETKCFNQDCRLLTKNLQKMGRHVVCRMRFSYESHEQWRSSSEATYPKVLASFLFCAGLGKRNKPESQRFKLKKNQWNQSNDSNNFHRHVLIANSLSLQIWQLCIVVPVNRVTTTKAKLFVVPAKPHRDCRLSVHLSVCPTVHLSVHLPVCLSVCTVITYILWIPSISLPSRPYMTTLLQPNNRTSLWHSAYVDIHKI